MATFVDVDGAPEPEERRVLLNNVSWDAYVAFRDSIESAAVRMTYLEGQLEILSPSRRHEDEKKLLARLLEVFALDRDIPLYGHGSVTLRAEAKEVGLEPDECYCRGVDKETPELASEIVVTRPLLTKLEVYRGLGIGEVWTYRNGKIQVHVLREGAYQEQPSSVLFPEVDLELLAKFAGHKDQHLAIRDYRARARRH